MATTITEPQAGKLLGLCTLLQTCVSKDAEDEGSTHYQSVIDRGIKALQSLDDEVYDPETLFQAGYQTIQTDLERLEKRIDALIGLIEIGED